MWGTLQTELHDMITYKKLAPNIYIRVCLHTGPLNNYEQWINNDNNEQRTAAIKMPWNILIWNISTQTWKNESFCGILFWIIHV